MDGAQRQLAEVMGRAASQYNRVGPQFFTEIADRLLERANVAPNADVLDVATGPGVLLARLPHGRGRLVGIDLSRGMIEEARARLAPEVELYEMDSEALGFPEATFDAVLCASALQQFPNPERAFREFGRVLRPGGTAAAAVFGETDARWQAKDALLARLLRPLPRVGERLDIALLERLFKAGGFEHVRIDAEHLDISFFDEQAWVESAWSHGERRALEALDQAAYAAFREALPDALEPAREADGFLHWRPEVIFAVGVKPD